jgi:hypothetical protein
MNSLAFLSICASKREGQFKGEICLHSKLSSPPLDKRLVWTFPQLVVCLDCGFARFTVPEKELKLNSREPVKGWLESDIHC